jgi:hypothetical protein
MLLVDGNRLSIEVEEEKVVTACGHGRAADVSYVVIAGVVAWRGVDEVLRGSASANHACWPGDLATDVYRIIAHGGARMPSWRSGGGGGTRRRWRDRGFSGQGIGFDHKGAETSCR